MNKSEKEENLVLLGAAAMISAALALPWFENLPIVSRILNPYSQIFGRYFTYFLFVSAGAVFICMHYVAARRHTTDQDIRAIRLGLVALIFLGLYNYRTSNIFSYVMTFIVFQSLLPALRVAFNAPLKTKEHPGGRTPSAELS